MCNISLCKDIIKNIVVGEDYKLIVFPCLIKQQGETNEGLYIYWVEGNKKRLIRAFREIIKHYPKARVFYADKKGIWKDKYIYGDLKELDNGRLWRICKPSQYNS
jgi:hypothetical protein